MSSFSPIGGHSVTRTELKYEKVHQAQTAQKVDAKTENNIFHLSSGNWVAAYWEIAANSAYDMFSKYRFLIVNLVFLISVFGVGISF